MRRPGLPGPRAGGGKAPRAVADLSAPGGAARDCARVCRGEGFPHNGYNGGMGFAAMTAGGGRRLAGAALALAFLGAPPPAGADSRDEEAVFEAMTGYMMGESGNYLDAATRLLRIGMSIGDGGLLHSAAEYAWQARKYGLALKAGREWVEVEDSLESNRLVARVLINMQEWAAARPVLAKLVEEHSIPPAGYRGLVADIADLGERRWAIRTLAERYPGADRDGEYYETLARLYLDAGMDREAVESAAIAVGVAPDNTGAATLYTELLLDRDYDSGHEQLASLASGGRVTAEEFYRLAAQVHLSAHARDNLDLMRRAYFRPAIPSEELYYLARMALFSNDPDLAREYLALAVSQAPEKSPASFLLAFLMIQARETDRALGVFGDLATHLGTTREVVIAQFSYYQTALKGQPSVPNRDLSASAVGSYRAGTALKEMGKPHLALQALSKVGLESGILHFFAQIEIANILMERGDHDAVASILQHLRLEYGSGHRRHLNDRDMVAQLDIAEAGLIEIAEGKRAAMDFLFRRARELPDPRPILYRISFLAEELGESDVAEEVLRRYVALPVRQKALPDPEGYNALGYLLADHNRSLPEARDLIGRAIARTPGDPNVIDSLGWVQYRQGDLEGARKNLIRAAKLSMAAEIHAHLGEVLWKLGDRDAASVIWRRALYLHPDNKTLLETIDRLGPL